MGSRNNKTKSARAVVLEEMRLERVSCPVCRRKVSTWGDRLQSASPAALLGREQQVQPRAETLE